MIWHPKIPDTIQPVLILAKKQNMDIQLRFVDAEKRERITYLFVDDMTTIVSWETIIPRNYLKTC